MLDVQTSTALWFCFGTYAQLLKVKSKQNTILNSQNTLPILIRLVFTINFIFASYLNKILINWSAPNNVVIHGNKLMNQRKVTFFPKEKQRFLEQTGFLCTCICTQDVSLLSEVGKHNVILSSPGLT